MPSILNNLIAQELVASPLRVQVDRVYGNMISQGTKHGPMAHARSSSPAKSLVEFYSLVESALLDYETRAGTIIRNAAGTIIQRDVTLTEEEVDSVAGRSSASEIIAFSLRNRFAGSLAQVSAKEAAGGANIQNLRPVLRESVEDPANPTYRSAIYGYFYDNVVCFTAWSRTNKAANKRAIWLEDFMEEYSWWYNLQGVNRVIFYQRDGDIVKTVDNNKWYGRPLLFFVRTEKLRIFNEKMIEEVLINLSVQK